MELLTDAEKVCMSNICMVTADFYKIIGNDISREGDVHEVIYHIHALQNMIMAQAAARAYPGKYRLMGELV